MKRQWCAEIAKKHEGETKNKLHSLWDILCVNFIIHFVY